MDTFTFGNIAVGSKFKVVNIASGKVLSTANVCTKVVPFSYRPDRPQNNYTYVNRKGANCSGTLQDSDSVVLVG